MKLIMDAGFGRIWEIDGAKAVPGKYIDLSISGVDVGIPEASYAGILCSDSRQLRINARLLNFTAQLTAFIGKDNIGQNAALYSYNDETGKLVFQDISAVDRDGNVIFNIKCGGRYFIALGSEVAPPAYLCGDVNGDGVVNSRRRGYPQVRDLRLPARQALRRYQRGRRGRRSRRSADT